jgi:hypothetical protein
MKKSELRKIIREEIYRLMSTPIDSRTEILRKSLQKYQIDLNEVPESIIKGATDAMSQYADIEKTK